MLYFVYRSHYEGPLSKLVRRLPDESVLAWFQRRWVAENPYESLRAELGTRVYGLSTIFEAAQEQGLSRPETTDQLRSLLHEHLYVEWPAEDGIRLDEHSLRVRTDDDEVSLAYFFFDDELVTRHPERLAHLVHESFPLPDEPAAEPPAVPTAHAVFLTFYDGDSLEVPAPVAFPGVGLDGLADVLRRGDDPEWPAELRILAAVIGDGSLAAGLERANRWPHFGLDADDPFPGTPGGSITGGRRPELSLIDAGRHVAQMAMHCSSEFGYQQWFLFDSSWDPDLAASLLHYATDWDPLSGL